MRSPYLRHLPAFVAALALAAPARAEGPSDVDRRLAQSLFDHARLLLETGRPAEACPKFAESYRLEPASGTLLNLALCHEQEGKSASAWSEYNESLSLALKESRPEREQFVRERLAALGPKLLFVSVAPAKGADVEGLEVRFDGALLRRAAWGTPTAVDPGPHLVEASAPGRLPWSTSVEVDGAAGQARAVEVPPLVALPPAAVAPVVPVVPVAKAPYSARDAAAKERQTWAYGLGAAAGVALVVSLVTGLKALSARGDADDQCWSAKNFCSPEGLKSRDAARSYAWASTISMGVGLAAAVAVPLVLKAAPSAAPAPRKRAPRVGGGAKEGAFAVFIEGSF